MPFLTLKLFSPGDQCLCIWTNESLLPFSQTHALLLESAALAAPKRHLADKEMGGSQKTQCRTNDLPWLTATEWSDGWKRQLPAPCSPAYCQSFSCSWSVALTAQACKSVVSHQKGTTLLVLQRWTVFVCGYLSYSPSDLGRGFGRGSADTMGWTSNETPSFLLFWRWTCVYICVLVWTRKILFEDDLLLLPTYHASLQTGGLRPCKSCPSYMELNQKMCQRNTLSVLQPLIGVQSTGTNGSSSQMQLP